MSLGGMIETPDDIHHRRLSRSGRTHDGHELAPMDFQRNASKCVNFHVTHVVNLVNAIKADQGLPIETLSRCVRVVRYLGIHSYPTCPARLRRLSHRTEQVQTAMQQEPEHLRSARCLR